MGWLITIVMAMLSMTAWSITRTPMLRRAWSRGIGSGGMKSSMSSLGASTMGKTATKTKVDVNHPSFELVENTYVDEYGKH